MNAPHALERVSSSLRRRGLVDIEVFLKQGKTRRMELGPQGVVSSQAHEAGWAVRASGDRTSLFVCGTDEIPAAGPWPAPDGYPIQLPPQFAGEAWSDPADVDAPLLVEGESLELIEGIARELERELPGARLLRAVVEDGASSSQIANSNGVAATSKHRGATLLLEAAAPGTADVRVTEYLAERAARYFNPRLLSRRLTDRLVVRERGVGVGRDRGLCVLAPPVAVRVLAGLLPLLLGPEAATLARKRVDRQGRLAAEKLTIIDDPRLPRGLFSAGVDGEGVPTRRLHLVDGGHFRRPLVGWWQAEPWSARPAGCCRRPSWREPPQTGPSHLFIKPDEGVTVQSMLAAVARGYYFLEALEGTSFDLASDRFRLPVSGFQVAAGRASKPIAGAVVQGRISALLHGIQSVGRDLTFFPHAGALGAPSLLIHGLEIAP